MQGIMLTYLWFIDRFNHNLWIENRTSEKLTLVNDIANNDCRKRIHI